MLIYFVNDSLFPIKLFNNNIEADVPVAAISSARPPADNAVFNRLDGSRSGWSDGTLIIFLKCKIPKIGYCNESSYLYLSGSNILLFSSFNSEDHSIILSDMSKYLSVFEK